jgi:hypothetical protein
MPELTTLSFKNCSLKRIFLPFSFYILCISTVCGQTHSFSGNIGKYPIYLQLTLKDSKIEGYYFYKNKLVDIPFKGIFKSGFIIINTTDAYGDTPETSETFKFKWPNKAPVGTWSSKGKALELKLLPLTVKETDNPKCSNPYWIKKNRTDNPLTRVKIGLFRLKETDSVRTINQIRIRQFEETHTGISLFRIDSGLVASKQNDANAYLEYLQVSEFLEALSCASYSPNGIEFSYNVSDITLSSDLMCFSVFKTCFCGGAHPNEENYGFNYELGSKEKISSSDFLVPGKEEAFDERSYRYLAKTNPELFDENERAASSSVYTDCGYHKKELWQISYCDFVLTPEGIELLPSFPHAASYCMYPGWAVIPYSELKDLIKPEYYSKLIKLKQ